MKKKNERLKRKTKMFELMNEKMNKLEKSLKLEKLKWEKEVDDLKEKMIALKAKLRAVNTQIENSLLLLDDWNV